MEEVVFSKTPVEVAPDFCTIYITSLQVSAVSLDKQSPQKYRTS